MGAEPSTAFLVHWAQNLPLPIPRLVAGQDGHGENPTACNYYQFQVIIKPTPDDIQDLYLHSLEAIGVRIKDHDIRFVEDDWESPP